MIESYNVKYILQDDDDLQFDQWKRVAQFFGQQPRTGQKSLEDASRFDFVTPRASGFDVVTEISFPTSTTLTSKPSRPAQMSTEDTIMETTDDIFDLSFSNAKTVTQNSEKDLMSSIEENTTELRIVSRQFIISFIFFINLLLKICKELKSNLALRYQLFKYSFVHKVSILLNVLCKWSYKYKIFFQDTIYSNGCWHYLSSPRHSELLPLVSLATWKGT